MKDQERSVPRTSHGQTAHPTAVIHSHSPTWEGASAWAPSKLCLSAPRHQTRLEIIPGDGEGVAPGKFWRIKWLVKPRERQKPNQLEVEA